jgi:DNA-binding transcriptional regulator YiaG
MKKKTTKKKAKKSKGTFLGQALLAASDDAIAWHKGERELRVTDVKIDPPPEFSKTKIKQIRKNLNLSQPVFAGIMGFSPGAIKSWEQGKTPPPKCSKDASNSRYGQRDRK